MGTKKFIAEQEELIVDKSFYLDGIEIKVINIIQEQTIIDHMTNNLFK